MIATYHNHTTYSDGKTSIEDMVQGAIKQGVHELGISDHLNLHPSGRIPHWSMPHDRLADYVDEIQSYRGVTAPVLRLGLEVDWFPNHADTIRDALAGIHFDYLIGSVHEVDGFVIDASPEPWNKLADPEITDINRRYWQLIRSMADSCLFDIAAHLDLPKKFGHRPTADLDDVIEPALDAIAAADMVVELNTAGWHKPVRDGYPSLDILKKCFARKIPVTISADAHEPDHLLRDFPRAAGRLVKAGYQDITRFAARQRTTEHYELAIARF